MGGRRVVVPAWVDLHRLANVRPRDGWDRNAACHGKDPALFFAEKGANNLDEAKAICRRCPALYACLAAHLDEDFGVFGGTTPEQRRAIRRASALRAAS